MRRGATGTAGLVLAGLVMAGCTAPVRPSTPPPPQRPTATPSATSAAPTPSAPSATPADEPATCTAEAGALGLRRQVGQLVMVGVGVELTNTQKTAITDHHLGSAIVMGPTPGGVGQVAALTAQLRELGGEDLLVAADQEGGLVQRLKGPGFGTIPSAARQARLTDAGLAASAEGWGRAMAKAGVLLDLAPVADVVPAKFRASNEPVARLGRGYGSDPEKVSRKVAAFSAGLHAAGVGVAVKHFPGLGAVRGNTDFATSVVDTTTTASSALLTPFRDAVEHGADAVMVSSATYRRIDPDHPAMFSQKVVGLLREWGFEGVVVSDDLGAAAALRSVPVARRAERFVAAGGDLALTVDARTAGAMADGLYAAAKDDPELAARVAESAARVLALKARLGRFSCG